MFHYENPKNLATNLGVRSSNLFGRAILSLLLEAVPVRNFPKPGGCMPICWRRSVIGNPEQVERLVTKLTASLLLEV